MRTKTRRKQAKFDEVWYYKNAVYYQCKKCGKDYLLENFNLHERSCKKCVKELKLKSILNGSIKNLTLK